MGDNSQFQYGQDPAGYRATPTIDNPQYQPYYGEDFVPEEVQRWNWGAFMYSFIWGMGNRAYMSLLVFVPLLGAAWPFVCGAIGNQWAWKSGHFKDLGTFLAVQETWNRAGFVGFIVMLITMFLSIMLFIIIFSVIGWRYFS
ncbi:MAG: ribonuclease G [Clostridiales Family XIII bacterium]|jgi:hypothetical protein|nr:ribonuclease G [Clostridiales Family XIII bacterium]